LTHLPQLPLWDRLHPARRPLPHAIGG
jgi:hypothetical protein